MRSLKLTLGDDKTYTFRTLTAMQSSAVQKQLAAADASEKVKRFQSLGKKMESEDGLDLEEAVEYKKLQTEMADASEMLALIGKMVRTSMGVHHKEFEPVADKAEDQKRGDMLLNIADLRDLFLIFQFITTGTIPKEDEIVVPSSMIDLSTAKAK